MSSRSLLGKVSCAFMHRENKGLYAFISLILSLFISSVSFAADFTAKTIGDYGNITVMAVTGDYNAMTPDGTINSFPRETIGNEFFKTHKDEYDFLVIFTNFEFRMPEDHTEGFYTHVKNDTQGIGLPLFDDSLFYGSDGRLQGTIDMGNIGNLVTDLLDPNIEKTLNLLAHEQMHRWGAYVRHLDENGDESSTLLGRSESHWSFLLDADGSVLYGSDWRDNWDGTFTSTTAQKYYSPLDLYLMGLIDKNKVSPMLLIENPDIDSRKLPKSGVTVSGNPKYITIEDIIAVEGERVPGSSESQRRFKTAFILITMPDTFTGIELQGVENIRNLWLTRFSILADGGAITEIVVTPIEELPENSGIEDTVVIPRTLPPDINDGVTWIMTSQQVDGSWRDSIQTEKRDTAQATDLLRELEISETNFLAGLEWIKNSEAENTDYLVRKIATLLGSGENYIVLFDELFTRQNHDGGWGSQPGYQSNVMDTSLTLGVASKAGSIDSALILNAIEFLKANRNVDGGWGYEKLSVSMLYPTTTVLTALNQYKKEYSLDVYIENGIDWLKQKANSDGGYGNSPSTVSDTSLAILALMELGQDSSFLTPAVDYLLSLQSDDGSWYGSVYKTALAVSAVSKATIAPELSIKPQDIAFIPASIQGIPSNIVINVDIWNLGQTDVSQAVVALYDGEPSLGMRLDERIAAFPAGTGTTITFQTNVQESREYRYYIVVDDRGDVDEPNEENNTAFKILNIKPTYDFEILSSGISVSPNPVDMFEDVTISSKITNNGTMNVYNLQVKYFIDNAEGPVDIATVTVDISAGETIDSEVTWRANKAGENLPVTVVVDPFDLISELSEENNQAVSFLTVSAVDLTNPNLTVNYQNLEINPAPAYEGASADISVLVKNEGFSAAYNIPVTFYRGVPGEGGALLGTYTIISLNAGESSAVSFNWTNIMGSGEVIIYVQVDPDNLISEIRKNDNTAFTTLDIHSLPDLSVSTNSIVFNPSAPKDGDAVSIEVTVQNTGDQDISDVLINAFEGNATIGSQIVSLIPGNSQVAVLFTYDTSEKTGAHEITVTVDPDNTIMEQSDDNNTASRFIGVQDSNLWLTEQYISPNGDVVKDSTQFFFRLDRRQSVKIIVVNKKGETVKTFSGGGLENITGGNITWKGLNDNGMVVDDGDYQIQIVDVSNNLLGGLLVVVDTNRFPLTEAIGTKYLVNTNITCMLPDIEDWAWFPDERGILFHIDRQNPNTPEYPIGLYTMAPNGENIIRLVPLEWGGRNDPIYGYSYAAYELSPDGEQIAFILNKYNKEESQYELSQLWLVDSYGKNLTLLNSFDETESYTPILNLKWSPDGKYIAYVVFDQNTGLYEVWIIETNGIEKTMIDEGYIDYDSVKWSPDSKKIAYQFSSYNTVGRLNDSIRATDVSGNKADIFTQHDDNFYLQNFEWLNDQKIIVQEENDDYNYYSDTSKWMNVLWLIDATVNGDQIMISDKARYLTVSPDKKRFAFVESDIECSEVSGSCWGSYYWDLKISDDAGNTYVLSEMPIFTL